MTESCKNNDIELWRENDGDYYSPSIRLVPPNGIGINVGGSVIVKTLEEWHKLGMPEKKPNINGGDDYTSAPDETYEKKSVCDICGEGPAKIGHSLGYKVCDEHSKLSSVELLTQVGIVRKVYKPVVCKDGIHCGGYCPYLNPYGEDEDLTAKCRMTGNDLMWHDYWIADCHDNNHT